MSGSTSDLYGGSSQSVYSAGKTSSATNPASKLPPRGTRRLIGSIAGGPIVANVSPKILPAEDQKVEYLQNR